MSYWVSLFLVVVVGVVSRVTADVGSVQVGSVNGVGRQQGAFSPVIQCPKVAPKNPVPEKVSQVGPSDIKVVAAMGDSMTAGLFLAGATVTDVLTEYRDGSFSIGGGSGWMTLPNMIASVNGGNVPVGAPTTVSHLHLTDLASHQLSPFDFSKFYYNAARSSGKVWDLPNQAQYLLENMQKDAKVDFQNDWKLVTILIGANDVCASCFDNIEEPDSFASQLESVLEKLQATMPRTIVSLITAFKVSQVASLWQNHTYCVEFHKMVNECPCLRNGTAAWQKMDDTTAGYNQKIMELGQKWASKSTDTFAVRVQPVTSNLVIPSLKYVSIDCFHPSAFSDRLFAIALWNSMLSPVDKKPTNIDPDMQPICPTAASVLQ